MQIRAVAFDIDGTLYPNRAVYARLVPFAFTHPRFLIAFGRIRKLIRDTDPDEPFHDRQAHLLAQYLRREPASMREKIERKIYRGWEPIFLRIKLYPFVIECIEAFRAAGLRLGVLSDFPAERKIDYLGLKGRFDAVLCSEESGELKPGPRPFAMLAEALGVPAGQILFVGNSVKYDIAGAKQAGMVTALIARERKRTDDTDFVFKDYRDLRDWALGLVGDGGRS